MCETFHAALATQPDVLSIPPLTGPKWYACYTRGHHEKRVATTLRDHQIESFLPTHSQERRWSDRIKKIASPLFPSYVFARFRLRELPRVLDVAGVVTVVRAGVTPVTKRTPFSTALWSPGASAAETGGACAAECLG